MKFGITQDEGKPRVLVLDEEIPLPANTGKRIRTLNLLTELAGEFTIDLLVHDTEPTGTELAELEDRGIRVEIAPSSVPPKSGPGFPIRLARNLLSRRPYSVDSHDRPAYRRRLRELLIDRDYRLVHVEWSVYAHYAEDLALPRVVSAHNVEAQIWQRMAAQQSRLHRRWFVGLQARRMLRYERESFAGAPFATAVSESDAASLRAFGCRRVDIVPNGVDVEHFSGDFGAREEERTLVFTGSMDWRPNQDAVVHFIEDILEPLRRHGHFRLLVVGRNPPTWLEELVAQHPEIELTGTVDDVRPYMARGAVFVVPLRIGGGSRLKILEAFSMARAVVSTTVGAEGLDTRDGRELILADDPRRFAEEVAGLCADARRRAELGVAGRSLVERQYSWKCIARRQAALWRDACAENKAGRTVEDLAVSAAR